VVQWGACFDDDKATGEPRVTLAGYNVDTLACTANKIFALTRSGAVYVFPAQYRPVPPSETRPWYARLFGPAEPGVRLVRLEPDVPLERGERFVDIDSGEHHVVARTSSGRTFAVPADRHANDHGQLGVRKVELSDGRVTSLEPDDNLTRRTLAEKPAWSTPPTSPHLLESDLPLPPGMRRPVAATPKKKTQEEEVQGEEVLSGVDWDDVACCTKLHEILSLKGIKISEIRAGDKHTVALAENGRVLGWGDNSFG
jgi:hypothetical protein